MWTLILGLVESPAFLTLLFIVIFGILGYLFKYKVGKEEMKAMKEHFKEQKIDLARIEKRLWDLATGNDQMPLDSETEKRANERKE